jgi:hypothetical protein
MLSVSSATRVLVTTTPVDLRGSFNRLYSLVVEQLKGDPMSGHLFVFTNGRRQPGQGALLGWVGFMGLCKKIGTRPLHVACERKRPDRFTGRRVQRTDSWIGSAVKKELVSPLKCF